MTGKGVAVLTVGIATIVASVVGLVVHRRNTRRAACRWRERPPKCDADFLRACAIPDERLQIEVALAARQAIPAVYPFREFTADGGLISYGNDVLDTFRQGGVYAGRILKGDKPADLPVLLATKFELVVNMKTAKSLGITVSNQLQILADEVIE